MFRIVCPTTPTVWSIRIEGGVLVEYGEMHGRNLVTIAQHETRASSGVFGALRDVGPRVLHVERPMAHQ